jgi:RNA polymerase sigma-70 factor (ECF subfamily)
MILTLAMELNTLKTAPEIERIRRGDPDAWDSVISQYQHRLYRYLLRLSGNPASAEDLFQQTWVRVMEKIGRYDANRDFDTWLFSVAHNLAVDQFRGRRIESLDAAPESGESAGERLKAESPDALDQLLESERAASLLACIKDLPAIHREVLALRFEEGMTLQEIARVASVPLSTVKSRLSRALEGLRTSVQLRFPRGEI